MQKKANIVPMSLLLTDIAKSYNDFATVSNAEKRLVSALEGDRDRIITYLQLIDFLPFITWEDSFSYPDMGDGWDKILDYLKEKVNPGVLFKRNYPVEDFDVFETENKYLGACHHATYMLQKLIPGSVAHIGFCESGGATSREWWLHSFLVYKGKIIETTGVTREIYTGVPIYHPDELYPHFMCTENISSYNFENDTIFETLKIRGLSVYELFKPSRK